MRFFNDARQNIQQVKEGWENSLHALRIAQIPAYFLVAALNSILQHSWHGRIHRPAGIEYLHQTVNMFQNMDILRECKGVHAQQRRFSGVCTKHLHIYTIAEHVLVFALGRFHHKKRRLSVLCDLIQQMVDRIGFACAGRASDERVGSHCLPVQDQACTFRLTHVVNLAQIHLVLIRHRFVRYITAKLCVFDYCQSMHRPRRKPKVYWQFLATDQSCRSINQTFG